MKTVVILAIISAAVVIAGLITMRVLGKTVDDRRDEARRAREKAEAELLLTKAQTGYYENLGEVMRKLRVENHFGQMIETAFQRNKDDQQVRDNRSEEDRQTKDRRDLEDGGYELPKEGEE